MKEIEILVQVFDTESSVLEKLNAFHFSGDKETTDTYYFDPLRQDLKPSVDGRLNACFRVRFKDGACMIAYKNDHFDNDTWLYSDEYETTVGDEGMAQKIIESLGLQKLVIIKNLKRTYTHNDYTIEFEHVEDLGLFLEVEYVTDSDADVTKIKWEIQEFINSLGLHVSEELNAGKPELMLRRKINPGFHSHT